MASSTGSEAKIFLCADIYQGHFQTAMVKVVVGQGLSARTFYAHEGILSKSPFFERALNGRFKESVTREVKLPEDEPDTFSSVLEYLYGEEYSPRFVTRKETRTLYRAPLMTLMRGVTPSTMGSIVEIEHKVLPGCGATGKPNQQGEAALRHAKIYCLAEKLGLESLQTLAMEKLRLCGPVRGIHFIRFAAHLVENCSDDGMLSAFLAPYVQGIPEPEALPMD